MEGGHSDRQHQSEYEAGRSLRVRRYHDVIRWNAEETKRPTWGVTSMNSEEDDESTPPPGCPPEVWKATLKDLDE